MCIRDSYYLGLTYERLGQTREAEDQYVVFLGIWGGADIGAELIDDANRRLTALRSGS